jgi:DNA polymerase epsilon subunit 2
MAQRYALTHQRILRHKLFRPNDLLRVRTSAQAKLTPIESLLGKRSNASESLLLLGILIQIEEGHYYLEDPSGQVPVSFQAATAVDGFYVTEHCILLVEGSFQDDILYIHRLGHPLLETRKTSLAAIHQQISHPAYQLLRPRLQHQDTSFVILSEVKMDQPRVLQQLEGLLASYESCSPFSMPLFVLMGNFSSSLQGTADAMADLVALLSKFPSLASHAHFCIVPGPRDTPAHCLPLPPLSKPRHHHKLAHLHMASNPCRIRWAGREMVIFCHNLLNLLQQRQIMLQSDISKTNDNTDTEDEDISDHLRQPHCRLVKTVLDQGHLVPVAGVPIYWNYDHALRLYPLPDALILGGGDDTSGFDEIYGDCDVIHPGSLATQSIYAVYHPNRPQDDGSDDSDDDSMMGKGKNRVEFCRAGEEVSKS